MGIPSGGVLTKMQIIPMDDPDGAVPASGGVELMINPKELNHSTSINYNETKALGQTQTEPQYVGIDSETLSFDTVIDGTGVVKYPITALKPPDVVKQINKIKKVIKYDGQKHQPKVLAIKWGTFLFIGYTTSLTIKYNLFKPTGKPLRANLSFRFTKYISSKKEAKEANKTSPDLTHYIEVKAGDNLPLLCMKIYNDCSYYSKVAKINGLTNFRNLKPGSKLYFPPLN